MTLGTALARRLVRFYPRAWRDRYRDEMLALIDDTKPGARGVLDLARGLAGEWRRTIFGWRPGESARLSITGFGELILVQLVAAGASLAGPPVAGWIHAVAPTFRVPALLGPFVVFVACCRALIAMRKVSDPDAPYFPLVGNVELAFWIGLVFVTSVGMAGYDFPTVGALGPVPGMPPEHWWTVALRGTNVVTLLFLGSVRQARRTRRLAVLRKAARQSSAPHNPLGLGPSA